VADAEDGIAISNRSATDAENTDFIKAIDLSTIAQSAAVDRTDPVRATRHGRLNTATDLTPIFADSSN